MDKVFFSDITRNHKEPNNDLYNLLNVESAVPILIKTEKDPICDFEHKVDKHYVPKKKSKLKVLTVRDIRKMFEKMVQADLQKDLDKQQNVLMRIIRSGSSRNDQTKLTAKTILTNDEPISRMSWQMLMNINPEDHSQSSQFVMWKGKCIRVCGSKGGKKKFLCNHDLNGNFMEPNKKNSLAGQVHSKRNGLLRNSLAISFKPGPLTKKKNLDNSYQKHNVGDIELINLPKPGLEIQPKYGSSLDSSITNLINNFREEDGVISRKWAEFAVSVLGTVSGTKIKQTNNVIPTTFDLKYMCNQQRILMRRSRSDLEIYQDFSKITYKPTMTNSDIIPEVRCMMNEILDSVEISINQHKLYTGVEEPRISSDKDITVITNSVKEKNKRKYCELGRLDVTVIKLPENESNINPVLCRNEFCALGCICKSLQCDLHLKEHCGRIECMFECKCDFSKYKFYNFDGTCSDFLPGLINLDNELSSNLAKEEQKFHQTVIVSGDKSILLKSKRRNWKTPKRYADFYSSMSLKSDRDIKPELRIFERKLNFVNVEPWCMVHNLYKCFCKGKFVETSKDHTLIEKEKPSSIVQNEASLHETKCDKPNNNSHQENSYKTRLRKVSHVDKEGNFKDVIDSSYYESTESFTCARIRPFVSQQYDPKHYFNINDRIRNMESDDKSLQKRLLFLINQTVNLDKENQDLSMSTKNSKVVDTSMTKEKQDVQNENENVSVEDITFEKSELSMFDTATGNRISNKPKLVAWLESSYKHLKKLMDMGIVKTTLDPPKKGKVALYHWDFILNRYKERKNLFLISKDPPYRIFICVDKSSRMFEKCMSIDDIRFADLHKYPVTVKYLLTNASDMKDHFCILFGTVICWELVGSVMKVNNPNEKDTEDDVLSDISDLALSDTSSPTDPSNKALANSEIQSEPPTANNLIPQLNISNKISSNCISNDKEEVDTSLESSKWFVMTVENDFSEIQFYNKGFFVKYESITRAINVARMSGKTVRLSSQKCADKNTGPQFGIYAIPTTNEDCVFVGPYETDENLGIETVKNVSGGRKLRKTRGVWINTNKVDNLNVIDNPLSFMPLQRLKENEMLPIEGDDPAINKETSSTAESLSSTENILNSEPSEKKKKLVKPIKIKKCDKYFKISPKSNAKSLLVDNRPITKWILSNAPTMSTTSDIAPPILLTESIDTLPIIIASEPENEIVVENSQLSNIYPLIITDTDIATNNTHSIIKNNQIANKPVAEVAPQIKIAAVYSEALSSAPTEIKRPEKGMFILKPEEINQRVVQNQVMSAQSTNDTTNSAMDIEDFIDSSIVCNSLDGEAFVISDDDEEGSQKQVWIKCKNIKNFGMIPAKLNCENCLSFEFPGFKYTGFYPIKEAFLKINQVLSRKVLVPKNLNLEWGILDKLENVESSQILKVDDLNSDMVLTRNGLIPKATAKAKHFKTYVKGQKSSTPSSSITAETKRDNGNEFLKTSELLNNEIDLGSSETISNKEAITKFITEASVLDREECSNTLFDLNSQTED